MNVDWPALFEVAWNLLAACLAGGIVGLKRSYNGRVAGLRTHALVALAAASAMTIAYAAVSYPGCASGLQPSSHQRDCIIG